MNNYTVITIDNSVAKPFILKYHYLKRMPSIKYSFGLYKKTELVGVITFGIPNLNQRSSIAGLEFASCVYELNRLCLKDNLKNEASYFVSRVLKMLPNDLYILSYADEAQGHKGIVYQACNFRYYGTTKKNKEFRLYGLEHLHSKTAFNLHKNHGLEGEYVQRSTKHRYIYVTGDNNKEFLYSIINFKQQKYPKS